MKKLLLIILLMLCLTANVGQAQFNDSEKMFGQMLNLGHWSTDGLVFYWRGIEAGNAVDESFYRNHGTITGATWAGQGLTFAGGTDDITVSGQIIPSLTNFTVSIWFNVPSVDASVDYLGFSQGENLVDDLRLYTNTDLGTANGEIRLFTRGVGEVLVGPSIRGVGLTHLAVTRNGTTFDLYVNGVFNATGESADNIGPDLIFGGGGFGTYSFVGQIEVPIIYTRALSASEIQQLYINRGLPMQDDPIWLMYSPPAVGGSLQWILDGGIGPSPLKGSVVR